MWGLLHHHKDPSSKTSMIMESKRVLVLTRMLGQQEPVEKQVVFTKPLVKDTDVFVSDLYVNTPHYYFCIISLCITRASVAIWAEV